MVDQEPGMGAEWESLLLKVSVALQFWAAAVN